MDFKMIAKELPKLNQKVNGRFSRRHGLQWPLHKQQIGIALWFILNCITYFLVLEAKDEIEVVEVTILAWTGLFLLATIVAAAVTTTSDCTDPVVYIQRYYKDNIDFKNMLDKRLSHECDDCECLTQEFTKHCNQCNRCSYKLDHHCKWLNNCISEKNYVAFIFTIISLLGFTTLTLYFFTSHLVVYSQKTELKLEPEQLT